MTSWEGVSGESVTTEAATIERAIRGIVPSFQPSQEGSKLIRAECGKIQRHRFAQHAGAVLSEIPEITASSSESSPCVARHSGSGPLSFAHCLSETFVTHA